MQAIRTDPFLYGYLQPLNTLSSRQILTSNYYGPAENGSSLNSNGGANPDPTIVDKYVIDYPIGYFRGGDAFDLWYKLELQAGQKFSMVFKAGALAQGEANLQTPYIQYYAAVHDSPSGIVEEELRIRFDANYKLGHGLELHGGVGWQGFSNAGHLQGNDLNRVQGAVGMGWSFPE